MFTVSEHRQHSQHDLVPRLLLLQPDAVDTRFQRRCVLGRNGADFIPGLGGTGQDSNRKGTSFTLHSQMTLD